MPLDKSIATLKEDIARSKARNGSKTVRAVRERALVLAEELSKHPHAPIPREVILATIAATGSMRKGEVHPWVSSASSFSDRFSRSKKGGLKYKSPSPVDGSFTESLFATETDAMHKVKTFLDSKPVQLKPFEIASKIGLKPDRKGITAVRQALLVLENKGYVRQRRLNARSTKEGFFGWSSTKHSTNLFRENPTIYTQIVSALKGKPQSLMGLSKQLNKHDANLSRNLRILVNAGLVVAVRRRSPTGRRAVIIHSLTKAGVRALADNSVASVLAHGRYTGSVVSPSSLEAMKSAIRLRILHDDIERDGAGVLPGHGEAFERRHGISRRQRQLVSKWEYLPVGNMPDKTLRRRFLPQFRKYAPAEAAWFEGLMGLGAHRTSVTMGTRVDPRLAAETQRVQEAIAREGWTGKDRKEVFEKESPFAGADEYHGYHGESSTSDDPEGDLIQRIGDLRDTLRKNALRVGKGSDGLRTVTEATMTRDKLRLNKLLERLAEYRRDQPQL